MIVQYCITRVLGKQPIIGRELRQNGKGYSKKEKFNVQRGPSYVHSVFHGKAKHFNIKFYFLREVQTEGEVLLQYCKTEYQLANIFTKALLKGRFENLRERLGVSSYWCKEECLKICLSICY